MRIFLLVMLTLALCAKAEEKVFWNLGPLPGPLTMVAE